MTNRLPLPLSTLKNIQNLIAENNSNLWVTNPLKNILNDICSYDYSDAVKGLGYLKKEFPSLMNYEKEIKAIQNAENRYSKI